MASRKVVNVFFPLDEDFDCWLTESSPSCYNTYYQLPGAYILTIVGSFDRLSNLQPATRIPESYIQMSRLGFLLPPENAGMHVEFSPLSKTIWIGSQVPTLGNHHYFYWIETRMQLKKPSQKQNVFKNSDSRTVTR